MGINASELTPCWFFLELNDVELSYGDDELIDVIMSVAAGKTNEKALRAWISSH